MKTLKFFVILSFIFGFTFKVNAQSISIRDIDIPWSFYIDCIGENAIGTLTLHTVIHSEKDGNWTSYHYQPQGGVLIGENTGNVYHTVGVTQEHWKSFQNGVNGAWTDTFINNYIAVGVGKDAVKWGGKDTYHITVTKDGEVTVEFLKSETFCK
jgi:hypothetical protein